MIDFFIGLSPVYQALMAGLFTWSITLLGASVVFFLKKTNDTFMDAMLGFSAGVMIAASFFSLIEPAIEMSESLKQTSFIVVSVGFLLGVTLLYLSDLLYKYIDKKKKRYTADSKKRCLMLISSITLHNIPEGVCTLIHLKSLI